MKPNFIRTIQRSRALKTVICCLLCLTLLFNFSFSRSAFAAPVVAALVPVAAEGIGELLALLGLAVSTGVGTYALTQNYPYVNSIFSGAGDTPQQWYSVLPENVYYTDGNGNYYIGNSTDIPLVSTSQLVFKASAVADAPSFFPSNIKGLSPRVARGVSSPNLYNTNMTNLRSVYGDNVWLTPYCVTSDDRVLVSPRSWKFSYKEGLYIDYTTHEPLIMNCPDWTSFVPDSGRIVYATPTSFYPGYYGTKYNIDNGLISWYWGGANNGTHVNPTISSFYDYLGNLETVKNTWSTMKMAAFMVSDDVPKLGLDVDTSKLGDVVICVGGSPMPPANFDPNEPEDNDPQSTGTALIPPSMWEVFTTIAEYLGKSALDNTNNSTTLGDFINNNYQYNNQEVEINVPDSFHIYFENPLQIELDHNISGGLDIDITVNDNTSLPEITAGDGENFFSANVIDVFAGLTTNNPVMAVLKELFGVIDPALVAIFSVTISLSLLLALWKLIKG